MYSKDYELTAVHEAGHAICAACFPYPLTEQEADLIALGLNGSRTDVSRIDEIGIRYDREKDGYTCSHNADLTNEKKLVQKVAGIVAGLMARSEGNWNLTEIQVRFNSDDFKETRDMEDANKLLEQINKNSDTKRSLAEFVSNAFFLLEEKWELVKEIADAVIDKYDQKTRTAKLLYNDFPPKLKKSLHELERGPYLKDI